ncbi:MAG: RluA family pseudouridine synthase [Bacteroidota bacterium]
MEKSRHHVLEIVVVDHQVDHQRAYDYLPGKVQSLPSRKAVKKAFKRKQIVRNAQFLRSGDWIYGGDRIEIMERKQTDAVDFELDIHVVYEDDYIAVVEKPAGLVSSGYQRKTLQHALTGNLKEVSDETIPYYDRLSVPLLTHRLDAKTHGLLLVAKTSAARRKIDELFQNRQITKGYVAIVQGELEGKGTIEQPVQGKNAVTHYESTGIYPSHRDKTMTLVQLFPETGRKHQLRIHLAEAGHPIVGDQKYTKNEPVLRHKGLFLVANYLAFDHPVTGEALSLTISCPNKFDRIIRRECKKANLRKG